MRPRHRPLRRSRLVLRVWRIRRVTALWLTVAALTAGATASRAATSLERAERFGRAAEVYVTTGDVDAGDTIAAHDVERRPVPAALVPAGRTRSSPVGRTALVPLVGGEVVVEARLGSSLVPDGWRAIAIAPPGMAAHPGVRPGDRVDIVDVSTPSTDGSAYEGIVVDVGDDGAVTVAVHGDAVAAVARAATQGSAVLALTAARPRR